MIYLLNQSSPPPICPETFTPHKLNIPKISIFKAGVPPFPKPSFWGPPCSFSGVLYGHLPFFKLRLFGAFPDSVRSSSSPPSMPSSNSQTFTVPSRAAVIALTSVGEKLQKFKAPCGKMQWCCCVVAVLGPHFSHKNHVGIPKSQK